MTDREALASALEILPVNDPDWRWDLPLTDIVAAARRQLALLKRDCRDCEGTGEEWASEARVDTQECFVCGGSGKVYPQETVEKIAKALYETPGSLALYPPLPNLSRHLAVAVLDALGETE